MFNKKQYEDDDGRVIMNMDVEGMRWFEKPEREEQASLGGRGALGQMTHSQMRLFTWYSFLAASGIVFVFSATWVLFTLFCIYIWFR